MDKLSDPQGTGDATTFKIQKLSVHECGYLVGMYLGDGSIYVKEEKGIYRVTFYLNPTEKEIIIQLKNLLEKLNLKPHCYKATNGSFKVEIYSKWFVDWIRKINATNTNIEFARGMIEGLVDSDGYVEKNGRITLTTSNEKLLQLIRKLLDFLEVKYYILRQENVWRIRFSHKGFKDSLSCKIRLWHPKR